jgi:hypothetical protein
VESVALIHRMELVVLDRLGLLAVETQSPMVEKEVLDILVAAGLLVSAQAVEGLRPSLAMLNANQ